MDKTSPSDGDVPGSSPGRRTTITLSLSISDRLLETLEGVQYMSVILAMAGVAHYNSPNCSELPYCINDVNAIKESFSRGLRVDKIINSGKDGFITKKDFISSLAVCSNMCKEEDILILYFSGHGNDDFEMCFTDETLSIQELINYLENNIIARHKILILDCCHAGHFTIESPKNKIRNIKDILSYKSQGLAVLRLAMEKNYLDFVQLKK